MEPEWMARVREAVEAMSRRGLLTTGAPYSKDVEARTKRVAAALLADLVDDVMRTYTPSDRGGA